MENQLLFEDFQICYIQHTELKLKKLKLPSLLNFACSENSRKIQYYITDNLSIITSRWEEGAQILIQIIQLDSHKYDERHKIIKLVTRDW